MNFTQRMRAQAKALQKNLVLLPVARLRHCSKLRQAWPFENHSLHFISCTSFTCDASMIDDFAIELVHRPELYPWHVGLHLQRKSPWRKPFYNLILATTFWWR